MEVLQGAYKDTKIGRIPKNWEVIKFGDVFDFIKTSSHSKNEMVYSETDSEIYNVHYGAIHTTYKEQILDFKKYNVPRITDDSKMPREDQFLKDGDLVIVDASEDWGGMGECVELNNLDGRKVIGGLHTYAVRDRRNLFTKGFTGYIFQNTAVRNKLASYANVSKVYGITKGNISNVSLVIPTLPEQQKIADILFTVDEQISTTDKIIEKSKELKKGLMQKLFSEGIGHTEFKDTKIGRIPKDWEVVKANELCLKVTDGTHDSPKRVDKGYNLVTSKNLKNGELDFSTCYQISEDDYIDVNKRSYVEQYDVLFGMIGTIGSPVMITQSHVNFAVKNVGIFKSNGDKNLGLWLCHFFNSDIAKNYIERNKNSSTQSFVALGFLRAFPIINPPSEERKKIADILSEADAKIEKEQTQKAQLEALKKGLMQQLLTGKKRVNV